MHFGARIFMATVPCTLYIYSNMIVWTLGTGPPVLESGVRRVIPNPPLVGLVFSYREIGDSEMKIYCKLVPALELSQNRREFHCSSDFPYSFPNNPPRRTGGDGAACRGLALLPTALPDFP